MPSCKKIASMTEFWSELDCPLKDESGIISIPAGDRQIRVTCLKYLSPLHALTWCIVVVIFSSAHFFELNFFESTEWYLQSQASEAYHPLVGSQKICSCNALLLACIYLPCLMVFQDLLMHACISRSWMRINRLDPGRPFVMKELKVLSFGPGRARIESCWDITNMSIFVLQWIIL